MLPCMDTTFCLSIHQWWSFGFPLFGYYKQCWFGQSCTSLYVNLFSFLWGVNLAVVLLGHMVTAFHVFRNSQAIFQMVVPFTFFLLLLLFYFPFTFLSALHEASNFSVLINICYCLFCSFGCSTLCCVCISLRLMTLSIFLCVCFLVICISYLEKYLLRSFVHSNWVVLFLL